MEKQMTFPIKSDLLLNSNKSDDFNLYLIYYFWVPCSFRGGTQSRFFSKVSQSGYLEQAQGLARNSKPIYEVCDSKSEKSNPMYCFDCSINLVFYEFPDVFLGNQLYWHFLYCFGFKWRIFTQPGKKGTGKNENLFFPTGLEVHLEDMF